MLEGEHLINFAKQTKAQKAKDLEDLFANAETREALGVSRAQGAAIDARGATRNEPDRLAVAPALSR